MASLHGTCYDGDAFYPHRTNVKQNFRLCSCCNVLNPLYLPKNWTLMILDVGHLVLVKESFRSVIIIYLRRIPSFIQYPETSNKYLYVSSAHNFLSKKLRNFKRNNEGCIIM